MINANNFKGTWGLKGASIILAIYSCLLFPAFHILFPQWQQWIPLIYPTFFGGVLLLLVLTGRVTWLQLGFHNELWKSNLTLGGLAGLLVIALVPLFDFLIGISGLDQTELFSGADQRQVGENLSFIAFILPATLITTVEQGFFTGYVFQALVLKIKPVLAIYLAGLIFALVHFDFQLGTFLIGLLSASFYCLNGSLVAPLIFQIACHIGGWLLTHYYSKVYTLLGFLF